MKVAALLLAVSALLGPAETADRAERRLNATQVTDTIPPPPRPASDICNSLTYRSYDSRPSGICFRAVTAERGWSRARIDSWFPFIVSEFSGVIQGESAHCWNVRRGEIIEGGRVCNEANKTRHTNAEDVGFGQATSSLWGSRGVLCVKHGVCSPGQILASPYTSMLYSIVLVVEELGSQPWCYDSRARSYHQCWEAPDR